MNLSVLYILIYSKMRLVLVTFKSSNCDVVYLKPYVIFLLLVFAIAVHTEIIKATFAYEDYPAERHM